MNQNRKSGLSKKLSKLSKINRKKLKRGKNV